MKSIAMLQPWQVEKARSKLASRLTLVDSGCHLFIGRGMYPDDYQMISVGGVPFSAHRLAYELEYGPINHSTLDGGKWWVLHKCDVPNCCNPEHLYLGSPQQNSRDMAERARMRTADRPQCRWQTPEDIGVAVGAVYWEYQGQIRPLKDWAVEFGLHPTTLEQRFIAGWPEADIPLPPGSVRHRHHERISYRRFSGEAAAMQARSTGLAPGAARAAAKDEGDSFFTLRIPGALYNQIKLSAGTQHISLNSFIVRAVERAAAQKGQQQ